MKHPAHNILIEFANKQIEPFSKEGFECATGNIHFVEAIDENSSDQDIKEWQSLLNIHLIKIAETHNNYAELYISDDGRYFSIDVIAYNFCYVANTLEKTIKVITEGHRLKPLLKPNEKKIEVYGIMHNQDSPLCYVWS